MAFEPAEETAEAAEAALGDAVADEGEVLGAQLGEGDVDGDAVVGGEGEQLVELVAVFGRGPGGDGAFAEGF